MFALICFYRMLASIPTVYVFIITQVYRQFLENVIQNLKDRFPDITLLKAFSIFDPEAMDFEPLQRENLQVNKNK